ncbi:MAG: TonB-dependent hemoglobin/transferrin/lactoferrin family receptor [Acidobacteriota bacterium]
MRRFIDPTRFWGALGASLLMLLLVLIPVTSVVAEELSEESGDEAEVGEEAAQGQGTFLDTVTVTASLSERTIAETPGQVDVIAADEIENLGHTNVADLVKYTPGVYVDGDVTRLGLSGFNIRGIGDNRVLTQVDGVPTAEQFDFGPFSVTQYSVDLDSLESAEIVRSAGSALYGSDALGGVVALRTRSPRSYLAGQPQYFGFKAGYDGRASEFAETLVFARGTDRWQGSILYSRRDGEELDNQGENGAQNFTRTQPNPIDRQQDNVLAKLGRTSDSSQLDFTVEWFQSEADTEILSSRRPASPFSAATIDSDAVDTQDRLRFSVEQSFVLDTSWIDSLLWRGYWQDAETDQNTTSVRLPSQREADRSGLVAFDQQTYGFDVEARTGWGAGDQNLLTYGVSLRRDSFDQLRDREEFFRDTGAPVPTTLAFPTKYFPESDVDELGAFLQAEIELFEGRLRLIPGVRFDSYDLDADQNDTVFLAGNPGTPAPVDLTEDSVSPKFGAVLGLGDSLSLFAQYAEGFRAPPMSAVNNGFTNQGGGYRTLPNPDLESETSQNIELGFRGSYSRGSFSIVAYENTYEDFIDTVFLGFNPQVFLVEFQPQNVDDVEISGLELAGELRFGDNWLLRGAYTQTEGDNTTIDEPLESIAPDSLVAGLRYSADRWGVEGTATVTSKKSAEDLPSTSTRFQAPAYEVFDLAAWVRLTDRLSLQATAWNLSDETYWIWANARGQNEGSATLDRFTSPGRNFGLQFRMEF